MTGTTTPTLTVVEVDPCSDQRWAVLAASTGGLFHAPRWLAAMRDAMGIRPRATIVLVDDVPRAGLALGEIDDALGARRSTFPFSDFCDPLGVADPETWRSLSTTIDVAVPYTIRCHRHPALDADPRLRSTAHFGWHDIELGPPEEMWDRLHPQARQNVRRARRDGVTVEVRTDPGAVGDFHRLHTQLRRSKYRMLAQPTEYFEALHAAFAPNDLMVVRAVLDGQVIAGILLLREGDGAYYKFNASLPDALASRANDLVAWTAMYESHHRWQAQRLDLGLSGLDQPGLMRYKRKFATADGELVTYTNDAAPAPHAGAVRRLIDGITAAVVDDPTVPDAALAPVASVLYRHFC